MSLFYPTSYLIAVDVLLSYEFLSNFYVFDFFYCLLFMVVGGLAKCWLFFIITVLFKEFNRNEFSECTLLEPLILDILLYSPYEFFLNILLCLSKPSSYYSLLSAIDK